MGSVRDTTRDLLTSPCAYLKSADVKSARVEPVPDEALWAFLRARRVDADATVTGDLIDAVVDEVGDDETTFFKLVAFLARRIIAAVYDDTRGVKKGRILHYTVAFNDRRRDGDQWIYKGLYMSDEGAYEFGEFARGSGCGSRIKFTQLPSDIQHKLHELGYFE